MLKWALSAFGSSSGIFTLICGLVLAGGLSFGYNYLFVKPSMQAKDKLITEQLEKINELGQQIGQLQLANESLVKTIGQKQKELEDSIKQLQLLNGIIDAERARADKAEAEIEADALEREHLDNTGHAEQVLDEDIAQTNCLNTNFGKPGGRCVKGKWTPD